MNNMIRGNIISNLDLFILLNKLNGGEVPPIPPKPVPVTWKMLKDKGYTWKMLKDRNITWKQLKEGVYI